MASVILSIVVALVVVGFAMIICDLLRKSHEDDDD
jgi:hypothetical protein